VPATSTAPSADHLAGYIDALDSDVRAEVRRRGVDPQLDVDTVRRMAAAAVRDHDQRSLTGAVLPVDDPDRVVDELVARVAGLGPLQPYLDDPTVEEIWINEPDRVFVARDGRHELTTTVLTAEQVRDLVERMLKTTHRRIDVSTPFVDAMLPSGHRLHVVLDGISRGYSAVNIRKFVPTRGFGLCAGHSPTCDLLESAYSPQPSPEADDHNGKHKYTGHHGSQDVRP
jgi:pilus assembly protein CpaF